MITWLVILSVLEVVIVVAALAIYVVLITRQLRSISTTLGRVAFGVRAVESQTGVIGPSVIRINTTLKEINAALGPIAEKAQLAVSANSPNSSP